MKVLISPISRTEALLVSKGGADIVDVKNTTEGSLGANFPWIIREIVDALDGHPVTFSATLGDLPYKPGTAALAAVGAAHSGARYIKAGLYGTQNLREASEVMSAVEQACRSFDDDITVVAAGYADYRRFGGLHPETIVEAAVNSKSDVVMVDTAIKDGATLFDNMTMAEIREFVDAAHDRGLQVALAGSIKREHIPLLVELGPDIIGVRGAVCTATDRNTQIEVDRVRSFVAAVREGTAASLVASSAAQ